MRCLEFHKKGLRVFAEAVMQDMFGLSAFGFVVGYRGCVLIHFNSRRGLRVISI